MTRPSKKPKYKLDPKKFESEPEKQNKEKDWSGDDIFKEMLREKSRHRHWILDVTDPAFKGNLPTTLRSIRAATLVAGPNAIWGDGGSHPHPKY